jgi:hypothetical protein
MRLAQQALAVLVALAGLGLTARLVIWPKLVAVYRLVVRLKPRRCGRCNRYAFAHTWDQQAACSSGFTSIVRMGRPEDDAA